MNPSNNSYTPACGCNPGPTRRDFLRLTGLVAAGTMLPRLSAIAGPFTREDFDHLVPADKKLSPDWIKSLFERGTPQVLSGSELQFAGMPVGGIGTGQLYLGGDGRLWHWDIFNAPDAVTSPRARLIFNARVEMQPEALEKNFRNILASACGTRLQAFATRN